MKSTAAVMSDLKAAGAPAEAVMIAVAAIDEVASELRLEAAELRQEIERLRAAEEDRRKRKTIQKQNERTLSRDVEEFVARQSGDNEATSRATVATKPSSPSPPKRYNQTPTSTPSISVEARAREWFADEFYPGWPNKVGRAAAERAGIALFRRRRGDMAAVIVGRDFYVANKPVDRPWLNPATFLNQERFDDEPAKVQQARAGPRVDGMKELSRRLDETIIDGSEPQHSRRHEPQAHAPDPGAVSLFDRSHERGGGDAGRRSGGLPSIGTYGSLARRAAGPA